jgi:hypothetical protein
MYWPDLARTEPPGALPMLGVPNSKLFKGLKPSEVDALYYDDHLNVNGMEYYTRAILPGVLELYEKAVKTKAPPPGQASACGPGGDDAPYKGVDASCSPWQLTSAPEKGLNKGPHRGN